MAAPILIDASNFEQHHALIIGLNFGQVKCLPPLLVYATKINHSCLLSLWSWFEKGVLNTQFIPERESVVQECSFLVRFPWTCDIWNLCVRLLKSVMCKSLCTLYCKFCIYSVSDSNRWITLKCHIGLRLIMMLNLVLTTVQVLICIICVLK